MAADNAEVVVNLFAAMENPYLHDMAQRSERENSGVLCHQSSSPASSAVLRRMMTEPVAERDRDACARCLELVS